MSMVIVFGCDNWYGDFHEVSLTLKQEVNQLCEESDEIEDSTSEDEELEVGELEFDDDEESDADQDFLNDDDEE